MRRLLQGLVLCLSSSCGAGSQAVPAATSKPAGPAASAVSLKEAMRHHFADATAARDAVIAGRLEDVRPPLRALASAERSTALPNDWLPWLEEMQGAAAKGAQARTLDEAATAVSVLGATCGECHRTTHGGVRDPASAAPAYDPQDRKGLEEKMARHKFSADALWLGLTGPAHQSWARGAAALMNINVPSLVTEQGTSAIQDRSASGEGSLQGDADPRTPAQDGTQATPSPRANTIDLDAALRELRALGTQADQAKIATEKQVVFGKVIAHCGDCHAALGVHLD
jgi:cytochrome c553